MSEEKHICIKCNKFKEYSGITKMSGSYEGTGMICNKCITKEIKEQDKIDGYFEWYHKRRMIKNQAKI